MKSLKQGVENNRGISGHMLTLHRRLYHALSLGRRYNDKGIVWHYTDIEMQKHVVRSISAFLDCVSPQTSEHPLVKDSVADMIGAVKGILRFKNGTVLCMVADVAVKLASILPNSILQPHVLDLVLPLSSLLSSYRSQVAVSCAIALHLILSTLNVKREKEVWEILKETNTVGHIVCYIGDFSYGTKPIEHFREMASLLSTIMWRWPSSRYPVWNDAKLMRALKAIHVMPDVSVKVDVLKLYSCVALCGNGVKKLLENGESLIQIMVCCMGSSQPCFVRIEGFKLAQRLAMYEKGCLKMMSMCCEPIIRAIISGMSDWISRSGKIPNDQLCLVVEACRLALVSCWPGEHHMYFWKLGVDRVLLDLLLNKFHKKGTPQHIFSLNELISTAQEGLNANFHLALRPYVWDILGWLAAHCEEDFNPIVTGDELCVKMLVTCACLAFVASIHKGHLLHQNNSINELKSDSACRAVLMMIYSPCKYIASLARCILSEILKLYGKNYLKHLIDSLNSFGEELEVPDKLLTINKLIGLACYSGLPQYQRHVIKWGGIKTLLAFMRRCLRNQVHIGRVNAAPHLCFPLYERRCCCACRDDWEGRDTLLLFSLLGLAVLIHHSCSGGNHPGLFSGQMEYIEPNFVNELQDICIQSTAPGPRWYAAYILCHFGIYGFPSRLGKRIRKALNEEEHADMQLILLDGKSLSVHSVVLMARCPLLLPPADLRPGKKTSDCSPVRLNSKICEKPKKEVHLSAYVNYQPLLKLLEFVYFGYLIADDDLVKKLKTLARRCKLLPLLQMLCRKGFKWGTPFPEFDLTPALGLAGHHFSDVILEAKATELMHWTCSVCCLSVPHMHVHKVILWSSCDYFRALFQSGMQESYSEAIKVPISWEALVKLVDWFYSDEIPKPISGCLWDNMTAEEKLRELLPYVELCWLAEFWLLGEIQEECTRVVVSCLDSARHLSVKIIQTVANLSLWKLVEVAVRYMAPMYHHLRDSGDLEELDEGLVEMVRAASVQLVSRGENREF